MPVVGNVLLPFPELFCRCSLHQSEHTWCFERRALILCHAADVARISLLPVLRYAGRRGVCCTWAGGNAESR